MNSKGIINIIIFTSFLVAAILLGNWFLSFVLQRPIEEVPTFAKVVVHGISMGVLFYVSKRIFIH
ncbi:hypothetical protein GYA27_01505 [candidate division WWE3 bacterium]|uniref:Uncharacterized protein n=1 Tax=candidate division WWE3 bacterium TaxID=2053526 RepID=A0A7X9HHR7_UNCKA|nr:hypothetical protein [candidate division WWE3 bacterium]